MVEYRESRACLSSDAIINNVAARRGKRGEVRRGGRRKSQGRTLPPVVARAPLDAVECLSLGRPTRPEYQRLGTN